jgi:hypothetical protein
MKLKAKHLATAALLVSTLAYASTASSTYTTYYSDATLTVVVGEKIFTCGNRVYTEGEVTPYYTIRITPCDGQP